ncbi:MAG: hypothetical protein IKP65_06285 [Alphaproteobacteria bacterium]|nr:hypothetical protein [Alphaproteobacteria bacterium]
MKNTNIAKEKLTEKEILAKRKMNLFISLTFGAIVLLATGNMYMSSKYKKTLKEEKFRLAQNLSFVSAQATSDVKKEVSNKKIISYIVDVDLNGDGNTDKTIALVDKVKYVSGDRVKKISKIHNGSKLVFECNYESHVKTYDNNDKDNIRFPEIIVDSLTGTSAVGLIDHLIAVDAEKINDARKDANKTYVDYLDTYKKDDGKWQDGAFDFLYSSNIQGR